MAPFHQVKIRLSMGFCLSPQGRDLGRLAAVQAAREYDERRLPRPVQAAKQYLGVIPSRYILDIDCDARMQG